MGGKGVGQDLSDFDVLRTVGLGTFALAKVARSLSTGAYVVLKIAHPARAEVAERELAIMQRLHHPHVVQLLGSFRSEGQVVLVLPFLPGGTLQRLLITEGALPEDQARWIFRQLASALQYCHARGVCHRDVKPANVLLDSDGAVVLCDFGLSTDTLGPMQHACGTLPYMAPEILSGRYHKGVDIWSLGVLLYTMVTGKPPSPLGPHEPRGFMKAHRLPAGLSPQLRHLLKGLLTKDPALRLDWAAISTHPWVTMGQGPIPLYCPPTPRRRRCLVLPAILFPRRCRSSPPVLAASSSPQHQAPLAQPRRCYSLPLKLDRGGPLPPPAPPNSLSPTPRVSPRQSSSSSSAAPTSSDAAAASSSISWCSHSSIPSLIPVRQGTARRILSGIMKLFCPCCKA